MNRSLDALILRYVGYALIFFVVACLLYLVRGVLPIFFVGGLLAYALEPILVRLERRGYSRRGAVGFVFLVFILLFLCAVALLASAFQQVQVLASNSKSYQKQFTQIIAHSQDRLEESRLPSDVKKSVAQAVTNLQDRAARNAGPWLQNAIGWVLGSVGTLFIFLIVLPIVTLWLMMEMNALRARLLMLVPPPYRRDVVEVAGSINEMLGRYVRGQMIVCGTFGFLCTVTFYALHFIFGMDYPLVLGILAVFLYIVPYVGMATIATSAGLTAYLTSSAPVPCALAAVGACVTFNLIIDYGISPRVLGGGVGLHPLMVIFALLSGAQVGGVLGMVLAIPVAASLRVVAIRVFPALAAPIPSTPPESKETNKAAATEAILRQTRDAEATAPAATAPAATAPAATLPSLPASQASAKPVAAVQSGSE